MTNEIMCTISELQEELEKLKLTLAEARRILSRIQQAIAELESVQAPSHSSQP